MTVTVPASDQTLPHLGSLGGPGGPLSPNRDAMMKLVEDLYPICRSITGDGVRETFRRLQQLIPLVLTEVPTGTRVFDWTIPREWNIRDAYIKNSDGVRLVDFARSNLHVLNYSVPVRSTMRLAELRPHLFTLPGHPAWIPYRTSYYEDAWGFCLAHDRLAEFNDGEFDVCIDADLADGSLTYGECVIPGRSRDEVLLSCHVCHPSLCNDNLSGIAVATFLARELARQTNRFTYRFLFVPGTIGTIAWLARNKDHALTRVKHGLVLTCLGDRGGFHYKKSRRGSAPIDRAAIAALKDLGLAYRIVEFTPYGYDERQYCSPGFNLPVGCLMRSRWGQFPEYHTSADDLTFVTEESLAESLRLCAGIMDVLEHDRVYVSTNPFCEPALGPRGLYSKMGGPAIESDNLARLWVLNLADGTNNLLTMAERSGVPFHDLRRIAAELHQRGLLRLEDDP